MRTSVRAAFAGVAVLTALLATIPLTGCGGGGKGGSPSVTAGRAKGTVKMAIVWPEPSRLIPNASNHIVVTLSRTPDDSLPSAFSTQLIFDRPANPPWLVEKTTDQLPTGTYTATATAYPTPTGDGTPDPATGANVAQATKTVGAVAVQSDATTELAITMDSTIATVVASAPAAFETNADKKIRIRPGEKLQLGVAAFDGTPVTGTPPGPYRVLLTPSKIAWKSSNNAIATVGTAATPGTTPGLVLASATLANTTAPQTVTITVTDTESQKSGTIQVTIVPVGLSQQAQWAKFHADVANQGHAPGGYPNTSNNAAWKYVTGSKFVLSSPVIGQDGTTYIGSRTKDGGGSDADKKLYALDTNGNLKWAFPAGGEIDNAPLIGQDGTIYFGTLNGDFYALQDTGAATGTNPGYAIIWQRKVGGPIQASPTIDKYGTVYVATIEPDNKLYAFNGLTGGDIKAPVTGQPNRIWTFTASNGVLGTPVLSSDGKRIYIASRTTNDSTIYIITTGIPAKADALSYPGGGVASNTLNITDGPIVAGMVLADINGVSTLFAATTTGTVLALDAITGGPIVITTPTVHNWKYDASAPIFATPAIAPDVNGNLVLYIATLDNTSGINDHKIVALDVATANQIWRTKSPDVDGNSYFKDGFTSSPAISGDGSQLVIGCLDGTVYSVDTTDTGAEHDAFPLLSTPSPGGGLTNALESSPALGSDGKLIIGGFDGTIYAVQ